MGAKTTTPVAGGKGGTGMQVRSRNNQQITVDGNRVLATTREGVRILKPRGNPSSFTLQQLREALSDVIERSRV